MQTHHYVACSSHTWRKLLGIALAVSATSTSLRAVELKFEKPSDFRRNFSENSKEDVLSVIREEGGLLRFATGDKRSFKLAAYAPGNKPLNMINEKIAAEFRFNRHSQSFGIVSRVEKDAANCYIVLVNANPSGALLRIFKGLPTESFQQGAVASQAFKAKVGEWYRLEMSTKNVSKGVQVRAKLMPAGGGEALASVEFDDDRDALSKPGHMRLRFFADSHGETDVRSVVIEPGKE